LVAANDGHLCAIIVIYASSMLLLFQGLPCHLYFDLEFSRRDNAERNGDEMVDLLISVTLEALFEKYSIQGNQDWIVELDSSTAGMVFWRCMMFIPYPILHNVKAYLYAKEHLVNHFVKFVLHN
jgi:hypothetical protein